MAASGTAAASVGLRLRQAASRSGRCVADGAILRCNEAETDPRVDWAACRRVGARSLVVVPLHQDRQVVGVLTVLASRPHAFTDTDPREIRSLLEARGHAEAVIIGGAATVDAFMNAGLVDELILVVEPVLFGKGLPLLNPDLDRRLELLDVKTVNQNTVRLHYSCPSS